MGRWPNLVSRELAGSILCLKLPVFACAQQFRQPAPASEPFSNAILQRILRHANVSTTATYYIKTAADDVRSAMAKWEGDSFYCGEGTSRADQFSWCFSPCELRSRREQKQIVERFSDAAADVAPAVRELMKSLTGFKDTGKRMLATWNEGIRILRDTRMYALSPWKSSPAFEGTSDPPKLKSLKKGSW
jgi:hypothetical protein